MFLLTYADASFAVLYIFFDDSVSNIVATFGNSIEFCGVRTVEAIYMMLPATRLLSSTEYRDAWSLLWFYLRVSSILMQEKNYVKTCQCLHSATPCPSFFVFPKVLLPGWARWVLRCLWLGKVNIVSYPRFISVNKNIRLCFHIYTSWLVQVISGVASSLTLSCVPHGAPISSCSIMSDCHPLVLYAISARHFFQTLLHCLPSLVSGSPVSPFLCVLLLVLFLASPFVLHTSMVHG